MEMIVGDNASRFIIAAGAVAIGILCLVAVLWIMRNRASSPFVRGGRNRQPRLAVLDAAAVDTRRRLVLVRRDDVEHLIMIGGPTDIVIESRIAPDSAATPDGAPATAEQKPAAAPVAKRQPEEPAVPNREPAPTPRATADQPSPPIAQPARQPVAEMPLPAPAIPPVPALEPVRESPSVSHDRVLPMSRRDEPERPARAAPAPMEPKPAMPPQPAPIRPSTGQSASEFERMLDAEISSDLQRLAPVAPRQEGARQEPSRQEAPRLEGRLGASLRQEPVLAPRPAEARKEPTIDEEMSRMLADISAVRKL